MKMLWLLAILTTSAFAERVVLTNPTFQGKPILARKINELVHLGYEASHAVCRLKGYARAVTADPGIHNTTDVTLMKTTPVVRAGTVIFDPRSIMDENWPNAWYNLDRRDSRFGDRPLGLLTSPRLRFETIRRIEACTEIASCRQEHPDDLRERIYRLDPVHPFVRQCRDWFRYSSQPLVFEEITCETDETVAWQVEIAQQVQDFARATGGQYSISSVAREALGTTLANPQICHQRYARQSQGSSRDPRPGECNYEYWSNARGGVLGGPLFESSFQMWLTTTGRLEKRSATLPVCAHDLLRRYSDAVIRPEYNLNPQSLRNGQAFCVEQATPVRITADASGETCAFEVNVKDFVQVPTTLRISLTSEAGEDSVRQRCQAMHACFQNSGFSCQNSNFCPNPGMIHRRFNP